MNHRLILSYDGLHYAGWQRQLNAIAVQQVVEEALAEVFDAEIRIHGFTPEAKWHTSHSRGYFRPRV